MDKSGFKIYLIITLFTLGITPLFSQDTVTAIEIEGLWRTVEDVVYREVIFSIGEEVTESQIEESIKNLYNLQLFSLVEIEKITDKKGVKIVIKLTEKWTVIPIFKAGGGGGTNYLNIGLYDINSFGQYLELGGQYERLGDTNSGVVWFRYPKIFHPSLKLGGDFWYNNRNHLIYSELESIGGYSHNTLRGHLFLEYKYSNSLLLGTGLDLNSDSYSDETLPESIIAKNSDNLLSLPLNSSHITPYLYTVIGELNYKNHLVDGINWELKISPGLSLEEENFIKLESTLLYFLLLPKRLGNIGIQVQAAYSTSEFLHYQFYLGGLDAIRGFYHEQFQTDKFLQFNVEYRLESINTEWFVLQHVLFTDMGYIEGSDPFFMSYGTGVRLISPRIYRLNIRLDYSFVLNEAGPGGLSFGLQHFF